MKHSLLLQATVLLGNVTLMSPIAAKDFEVPAGWSTDCVGRMAISMPGTAEVAAYSAATFAKLFGRLRETSSFEFKDRQIAGYSTGDPITHPLSQDDIKKLLNLAKVRSEIIRKELSKKNKEKFEILNISPKIGIADHGNHGYSITLLINTSLIETGDGDREKKWSILKPDFEEALTNLSQRDIGNIPSKPGICMPYIFKTDTGTERRSIATTWRLQEHPDITIMLKDEKAEPIPSYVNRSKNTPAAKIDFFWRQRYQSSIEAEYLWNFMRPIKLANVWGKAAAVKMTRRGGETDFGYYAVANGDPDAKEDTPNLELYVIQDSKNAKSKGIDPMNKEDFLELAQKIAASVRHRPITTP